MQEWLWLSLRIGAFGFLKEFRPEDPYITQYLVGPVMNLTEDQVNQQVYPVATYVGLVQSVFVFLLTDFLCYKPIIVVNALSGVISQAILIWGRGLRAVQVMEVFYATMTACEVAYYTYIYAKVDKEHYQQVTSHMRAAALIGRFTSACTSQLVLSFGLLTIADLNHLTFGGMCCALVCALTLPSMDYSLYFHRKRQPHPSKSSDETHACEDNLPIEGSKVRRAAGYLWADFKSAYTNLYVLKWCVWLALATCGFNQMMTYVQILWVKIGGKQSVAYNGAVEAIYTIASALSALAFGRVRADWVRYGECVVGLLTLLQGLVLLLSTYTDSMVTAYAVYVVFGMLYNIMLVITNSEVAKHLSHDSFTLIFGVNIFVALILQTVLTFTIAGEGGLALSITQQAAIVGYRTGKVLFIGVKNKYCTSCARSEAKGEIPKPHTCYKNWGEQQSSTSMEAAIICEGFQKSEEMYGLRYAKLIADGDSSVYKKILENRPYKFFTVEKVECKNHMLRNMCNRLKALVTTKTDRSTIYLRKMLSDRILRCREGVTEATKHRRQEKGALSKRIEDLRQDLLNIPSHVFGEHKNCSQRGYFCSLDTLTAPKETNHVPGLISVGLYSPIMDVFRDLSRNSRSLLADVTSNYVEHYNSIVAKFIGGKRINFAGSGSYAGRCSAAVVQHNTGMAHYKLHKSMFKSSPGTFAKGVEVRRKKNVDRRRMKTRCRKTLFSKVRNEEKDYGLAAQRPDIDEDTMKKESEEFLQTLVRTDEEYERIERETVLQSDSSEWLELRRNILTASNFGRVCKMRPTTGCESTVKQMLYTVFDCDAMEYGRRNEETARSQLETEIGNKIERCGLFIDRDYPYLGASPDGLVNDDTVVEIKCPSSAKELEPDEAIRTRKFTFWTVNKKGEIGDIQKSHNFYFQIQGQLQVTKRSFCIFAMWTRKGMKTAKIERDEKFWIDNMFPKLKSFYMNCLLPEIIDPRHKRSMPIRNPSYIEEAQKKAAEKKESKNKQELGSTTNS